MLLAFFCWTLQFVTCDMYLDIGVRDRSEEFVLMLWQAERDMTAGYLKRKLKKDDSFRAFSSTMCYEMLRNLRNSLTCLHSASPGKKIVSSRRVFNVNDGVRRGVRD